jgi:uncharacterized RDD family membrane protein YckC
MNLHHRIRLATALLALCLAPVSALRADDGDRVAVGSDNHIAAGEKASHDAVAVMGSLTVDGEVAHDSVAVFGSNILNGSTGHDDVAVLGDVAVNGHVGHDVVAVLGDVTLGPNARVEHDVVSVCGTVHRDPGAVVLGNVIQPAPIGHHPFGIPFGSWWSHSLSSGRLLSFSPAMTWLWMLHLVFLGLYALLALAFPNAVTRCGDVLKDRPGITVLTGLLSLVALPVLFILLLITIIGIPVALLALPLAIACLFFFGKAGVYGLIGRSIFGKNITPIVAVVLGGSVVLLLGLVPLLGLMIAVLIAALGFSCGITFLLTKMQRPVPAAPPAPPPAPAPAASPMAAPPADTIPGNAPQTPPSPEAPPVLAPPVQQSAPAQALFQISQVGLPRAGFWIRAGALLIDLILVGMVAAPFRHVINMSQYSGSVSFDSPGMLPLLALYGALMWKLRGTTVGGIIFGLKVVRLDDRPIDWATAIVRALGCFLSLIAFGLGFIWVAFDQDKQSWHDKIAGTVVVRVPKGVSLI